MIFKSALKYKIFEWCLDTLFDKITKNFTKNPKILRSIPKIGEYFSKIKDCEDDDYEHLRYFDCIIVEYVLYDGIKEISIEHITEDINIDNIGIGFSFAYHLAPGEELKDLDNILPEDLSGEVIGPLKDFEFFK